jgi:hypothetical protein
MRRSRSSRKAWLIEVVAPSPRTTEPTPLEGLHKAVGQDEIFRACHTRRRTEATHMKKPNVPPEESMYLEIVASGPLGPTLPLTVVGRRYRRNQQQRRSASTTVKRTRGR